MLNIALMITVLASGGIIAAEPGPADDLCAALDIALDSGTLWRNEDPYMGGVMSVGTIQYALSLDSFNPFGASALFAAPVCSMEVN